MTITEAFSIYDSRVLVRRAPKTRRNYRTSCQSLLNAIGNIPVELVSESNLGLWDQYMTEDGITGTTRRTYLGDIRVMMEYLKNQGMQLYDMRDFKLPDNDTEPRTWLAADEIVRLIAAAKNPRDKAILACTFLSGCRISEIIDLDRDCLGSPINADGQQEINVCGKRKKYRTVIFNKTARQYLDAYLETRADHYKPLFISGQNRRITVSRVEQITHQCARDAGLTKVVTPHVLRHSYTTDLLTNGASLYEVSKSLGHANIATTANIYGHFDTSDMKRVLSTHQSKIAIV